MFYVTLYQVRALLCSALIMPLHLDQKMSHKVAEPILQSWCCVSYINVLPTSSVTE